MYTLLVISLAAGMVMADVSHLGYNYKVPQTSYGVPSYQVAGSSADYNSGYTGVSGSNYNNYKGQNTNQGYQGSGLGSQNNGYHTGFQSSSGAGYQTGNAAGGQYYQTGTSTLNTGSSGSSAGFTQPSYQFGGNGYQNYNQYQTSGSYDSSNVNKYHEYYNQVQQQPAQIFKHFYVHAAPEDPEPPKYRQPITLPPPQKHYKVIFIKTPSQPAPAPQFIPVPQQNEEKTIVYVLVKKPEEVQDIVLPKVEQKPPSKPEVFFIKYNNKQDSQAVINNIVSDYNKGESVSFSGAGDLSSTTGSQTIGTGQYTTGGTGQYTQTGGSGHYTQAGGSAQYAQGANSGQYTHTSVSDEYVHTGTSAGTSASGSGQFAQSTDATTFGHASGAQSVTQASSDSSSAGGGQALSHAIVGSGTTAGGAVSSSASSGSFENLISTSQGVPHESYGPPTFRV